MKIKINNRQCAACGHLDLSNTRGIRGLVRKGMGAGSTSANMREDGRSFRPMEDDFSDTPS